MWDSRGGNLSSLLVQRAGVDEGHQEKVSLLKKGRKEEE